MGNLVLGLAVASLLSRHLFGPNRSIAASEFAASNSFGCIAQRRDGGSASSPASRFSWQQIESTNYSTYLKNLRSIGCPEQTVRDIIEADVHALFIAKRRTSPSNHDTPGDMWSANQENSVIAYLLGTSPPGSVADQVSDATPLMAPLVFSGAESVISLLDTQQRAAMEELRAEFIEKLGGTDQDPASGEYARRWRSAQPAVDRMLRGMIGVNAFNELQNEQQDLY